MAIGGIKNKIKRPDV